MATVRPSSRRAIALCLHPPPLVPTVWLPFPSCTIMQKVHALAACLPPSTAKRRSEKGASRETRRKRKSFCDSDGILAREHGWFTGGANQDAAQEPSQAVVLRATDREVASGNFFLLSQFDSPSKDRFRSGTYSLLPVHGHRAEHHYVTETKSLRYIHRIQLP